MEIEINWSSPASDQLYGVIQEYYICVREESGEACLFEITHNASITPFSATLSGLNPETTYRVRARAINGAGAGSYSDDFVITTGKCPYFNLKIRILQDIIRLFAKNMKFKINFPYRFSIGCHCIYEHS